LLKRLNKGIPTGDRPWCCCECCWALFSVSVDASASSRDRLLMLSLWQPSQTKICAGREGRYAWRCSCSLDTGHRGIASFAIQLVSNNSLCHYAFW